MSSFFWKLCTTATVCAATAVLVSEIAIDPATLEKPRSTPRGSRRRLAKPVDSDDATSVVPEGDANGSGRSRRGLSH